MTKAKKTEQTKAADKAADVVAEDLAVAEEAQSDADAMDEWAAALAEQDVTEEAEQATDAEPAQAQVFKPLDQGADMRHGERDLDMILDIPVKLNVELGRTRLTIKQLLELTEGSVVELDGLAGDPLDILINGYLVAQGEVVVVDDKYGIRIIEIVTPSERIHKLNR